MTTQVIDNTGLRENMLNELRYILSDGEFNALAFKGDSISGVHGVYRTMNVRSVGSANAYTKVVVTQLPDGEYVSWSSSKGWDENESVGANRDTDGVIVLTSVVRKVRLVEVEEWV